MIGAADQESALSVAARENANFVAISLCASYVEEIACVTAVRIAIRLGGLAWRQSVRRPTPTNKPLQQTALQVSWVL